MCSINGCKSKDVSIEYLGKPLCERCWNKFAEKPVNKLRTALGMKPLDGGSDVEVLAESK